ncbi:MAG: fructose-6-phosphate aldolase [Erysipelotrichaceae bacterium]|nr:fructose-6-phosphate aldolase [Erysipelotrichaceae bacterium]
MELLFDIADVQKIKKYMEYYPITGVTTNPSILKSANRTDFFAHLREIRSLITDKKMLHVQVLETSAAGILKEADRIQDEIDENVYIKVPVTQESLKAISALKKQGARVTATAIYNKMQGFAAILAGADYLAPYCNRMENLEVDFVDVICSLRKMIEENGSSCKIIGASFKNVAQMNKALLAGAHAITVDPALLESAIDSAAVKQAVKGFAKDWQSLYDCDSILDLSSE